MLSVNIKKTNLFLTYKAEFFLIVATIFWGGTFPIIKIGLEWLNPLLLLFLRFLIAFLVLSIWFFFNDFFVFNKNVILKSIVLGVIGFYSYYTQTIGLQFTTPPRSAFITQTLIIFVYLFQFFYLKKKISVFQWYSLFLILTGSYILFFGFYTYSLNQYFIGDFYTFLCAIGFAFYIVYIDKISIEEYISVVYFHFFIICMLSILMLSTEKNIYLKINPVIIFSLLYLSIPATLIATLILFYFQPKTTPVRATILYALEPVFATVFSYFINIEFTFYEYIGSILIWIGAIIGQIKKND